VPGPVTLSPVARRFLEVPGRYAVIATLGAEGSPHQATVWYGFDGDDLFINSRVGRRWPTDLLRDPRVSLIVDDSDAATGREGFVAVQARAIVTATGAAAMRDIQALGRRYGHTADSWQGQERISFRLQPLAVTAYGEVA